MLQEHAVAAAYWSAPQNPGKTRWWQSPTILRHINRLVCGEPLAGAWAGLTERMRRESPDGWERGISIACGAGVKEIELVKQGLVRHFDLFEISEVRARQGMELARQHGVSDRVDFHICDAFEEDLGQYDLVYWNNALHHMLDTHAAVAWSRERLVLGGSFVMDDFVGPNRHQWTEAELDIAQMVRELVPEQYLRHPLSPQSRIALRPTPHPASELIRRDPTEAADSENIVPAVNKYFPNAEIIYTGGIVYQLALSDVIANFTEDEDLPLLNALLLADEGYARAGLSHYAVAIARKS